MLLQPRHYRCQGCIWHTTSVVTHNLNPTLHRWKQVALQRPTSTALCVSRGFEFGNAGGGHKEGAFLSIIWRRARVRLPRYTAAVDSQGRNNKTCDREDIRWLERSPPPKGKDLILLIETCWTAQHMENGCRSRPWTFVTICHGTQSGPLAEACRSGVSCDARFVRLPTGCYFSGKPAVARAFLFCASGVQQ
jgi:hypothetical protein